MKIFSSRKCLDYSMLGHPECPERVSTAYDYLKKKGFEFIEPNVCSKEDVLLAHSKELLQKVKGGNFSDADTPALDDIYYYATLAAGAAIESALLSLKGEKAFSLMRPPGHHATRDNLGGFCYFNNIAIATMRAREVVDKVAVIDVDCHHGNGTQDIFLGRQDLIYISLHQSPLYPGTGLESQENCFNYPLAANTTPKSYMDTLNKALEAVKKFNPDLIGVSMGFDTYKLDPITSLSLEKSTYKETGQALAALNKPIFSILEGGYHFNDMPECIFGYFGGLG
ncbi:histone deacetylase family protein [Candidatus Omnitrophota bacterium]